MRVSDWLKQAEKKLEDAGIGTARLDALVLAEDITSKDRAYLLAHPEYDVRDRISHKLDKLIDRRVKHEPLAYIRGRTEFYGRDFLIDKRVLEPRPESETMIELLKSVRDRISHIVDVGTGSGALAITAKLEIPKANVSAVDIDSNCLQVAQKNTQKHSVGINFCHGDLLEPVSDTLSKDTALLCNLPYVPDDYQINQAAGSEPRIAIFGGQDGLELYRKLFSQIDSRSVKPQWIFTESLPFQHSDLAKIAKQSGFNQTIEDDFIQLFRPRS